jgi:predicted transcriptional regulator/adenylate kinase
MQQPNVVLLSLHPEHAAKILSGEKKLEFRRKWTAQPIEAFVIYVTAPVQKIVAIAYVKQVHEGSPTALWGLAKEVGGGLTRQTLYGYFKGKKSGFAIEIASVQQFSRLLDPSKFIKGFHPPQSFAYVSNDVVDQLQKNLASSSLAGRVIFVAGVHGVGKTTLCDNFVSANGLKHKSASQLIREFKQSAISNVGKAVKDIAGNQEILIEAVRQYRTSGETLILDGHFALWDEDHRIQPLEAGVFERLGIDGVIVVHDKPSNIARRLARRDSHAASVDAIDEIQRVELSRASLVAKDLGIPIAEVRSGDGLRFGHLMNVLC